jgi:uncharacterized protein YeaO (DUF488 family)
MGKKQKHISRINNNFQKTIMPVRIKRIYEDPDDLDGYRILVDRLWPRGIKKTDAGLDEWNKNIAPSTELRKWFHQTHGQFEVFAKKYRKELLENNKPELQRIRDLAQKKTVTLLYGARDPEHNHALILLQVLRSK